MYTLYTMPGSCSTGIHTLLNALELPVEIVNYTDVDNYQAIVPTGQVPALQDGDQLLTEGSAIALHLFEKHQVDLSQWGDKAEFNQWFMFCYATLHPAYSKLFSAFRGMPEGDAKLAYYQVLADKTTALWKIVDKQLEGKAFLFGDTVSLLDYLIAIYASWGNMFPEVSIKLGDNVIRVVDKVSQLAEFKAAYEKEGASHTIPANAH